MPPLCLLEWLKALGLPLLAVAVSIASILPARQQARIAAEKLRHDLYDRRYAIYMAFHELLVAIVEEVDVEAELRKANAARAQSPFLLDDQIGAYLETLHHEAFRVNADSKLVRDENIWPQPERTLKAAQLGSDKLSLANRVTELSKQFERFLKLKDRID